MADVPVRTGAPVVPTPASVYEQPPASAPQEVPEQSPKWSMRTKLLLGAGVFFLGALVLSGVFLLFGRGTISGENIAIVVDIPVSTGAGESLSFAVAVANRNAVIVQSATLIVLYPQGTQETGASGKEISRERIALGDIAPGAVQTVPLSARFFGEENEEKTIAISVEYRVEGSNATFFKEAEPARVKIGVSPVSLSVAGVTETSAGQEFTLTLTVASNAPAPLQDVLVSATYPFGFDLSESDPKPVRGKGLWRIDSLAPEEKKQIRITGVLLGQSAEERSFHFSAGVGNEQDRFALASTLATASYSMTLANPFVALAVSLNGSTEETIAVAKDEIVTASITARNTLSDPVHDAVITATLSGSGLSPEHISVSDGFFDSARRTITWDRQSVPRLATLASGASERVSFTIRGAGAERTPEVSFSVSVSGKRVSESAVPEQLTDVETRTIRFASETALSSRALFSTGSFANEGPMPPRAESATTYTATLSAQNGGNELADAVVTATLPPYVSFVRAAPGSEVTYSPASREVSWRIGSMGAGASAFGTFQVSFLPSISQVGSVPALIGEQHLRATDRFTGSVARATAPALTTALSQDPNPAAESGRVLPKE